MEHSRMLERPKGVWTMKSQSSIEENLKVLYTYPFPENIFPYIFLIPMIVSWVASLFPFWSMITELLQTSLNDSTKTVPLFVVTVALWIAGSFFLPLLNMYPSFWISQSGLTIQTFPFGKKFVTWSHVVSISPFHHTRAHLA